MHYCPANFKPASETWKMLLFFITQNRIYITFCLKERWVVEQNKKKTSWAQTFVCQMSTGNTFFISKPKTWKQCSIMVVSGEWTGLNWIWTPFPPQTFIIYYKWISSHTSLFGPQVQSFFSVHFSCRKHHENSCFHRIFHEISWDLFVMLLQYFEWQSACENNKNGTQEAGRKRKQGKETKIRKKCSIKWNDQRMQGKNWS